MRQFDEEAEELPVQGRRQIRRMHFPQQVMQYLDILVDECADDELTFLYTEVRETLSSDLSQEN